MVDINQTISIITLNVNGLNVSIKRQRMSEWIKNQDPTICCLHETHFNYKDTYRLKVNGWKKIYHTNTNQKKAGIIILISDRANFKAMNIIKDKEGYYTIIKGSILQKYITIPNVCVPNNRVSNYVRPKLIKLQREVDESTIIVGDFNSVRNGQIQVAENH